MQNTYDAVVVLGGGLKKEGGVFIPATYEEDDGFGMLGGHIRSHAAVGLCQRGASDRFMFTTGVYEKNKVRLGEDVPAESKAYAEWFERTLQERGIPRPEVILDTNSTTTLTNIEEVLGRVIQYGWKSIAVISNEYHIPRIRELYEVILRSHAEVNVHVDYVSAERVVQEMWPGKFDAEIRSAYESEIGRKRIESEERGLRDIKEGRYALKEFQLTKKFI